MAAGDTIGQFYENVGVDVVPTSPMPSIGQFYENVGVSAPATGQNIGQFYLGDVLAGSTHVGWGIPT